MNNHSLETYNIDNQTFKVKNSQNILENLHLKFIEDSIDVQIKDFINLYCNKFLCTKEDIFNYIILDSNSIIFLLNKELLNIFSFITNYGFNNRNKDNYIDYDNKILNIFLSSIDKHLNIEVIENIQKNFIEEKSNNTLEESKVNEFKKTSSIYKLIIKLSIEIIKLTYIFNNINFKINKSSYNILGVYNETKENEYIENLYCEFNQIKSFLISFKKEFVKITNKIDILIKSSKAIMLVEKNICQDYFEDKQFSTKSFIEKLVEMILKKNFNIQLYHRLLNKDNNYISLIFNNNNNNDDIFKLYSSNKKAINLLKAIYINKFISYNLIKILDFENIYCTENKTDFNKLLTDNFICLLYEDLSKYKSKNKAGNSKTNVKKINNITRSRRCSSIDEYNSNKYIPIDNHKNDLKLDYSSYKNYENIKKINSPYSKNLKINIDTSPIVFSSLNNKKHNKLFNCQITLNNYFNTKSVNKINDIESISNFNNKDLKLNNYSIQKNICFEIENKINNSNSNKPYIKHNKNLIDNDLKENSSNLYKEYSKSNYINDLSTTFESNKYYNSKNSLNYYKNDLNNSYYDLKLNDYTETKSNKSTTSCPSLFNQKSSNNINSQLSCNKKNSSLSIYNNTNSNNILKALELRKKNKLNSNLNVSNFDLSSGLNKDKSNNILINNSKIVNNKNSKSIIKDYFLDKKESTNSRNVLFKKSNILVKNRGIIYSKKESTTKKNTIKNRNKNMFELEKNILCYKETINESQENNFNINKKLDFSNYNKEICNNKILINSTYKNNNTNNQCCSNSNYKLFENIEIKNKAENIQKSNNFEKYNESLNKEEKNFNEKNKENNFVLINTGNQSLLNKKHPLKTNNDTILSNNSCLDGFNNNKILNNDCINNESNYDMTYYNNINNGFNKSMKKKCNVIDDNDDEMLASMTPEYPNYDTFGDNYMQYNIDKTRRNLMQVFQQFNK